MLNKRGHAPTLLLFVVALVLCIAAWFSFLTFNGDLRQTSLELQNFSDNVAFERTYSEQVVAGLVASAALEASLYADSEYESRFALALAERVERIGVFREINGNVLGLMRNGAYTIERKDGIYVFKLPGVFVQMESGASKIVQKFDIEIEFASSGDAVRFIKNFALEE